MNTKKLLALCLPISLFSVYIGAIETTSKNVISERRYYNISDAFIPEARDFTTSILAIIEIVSLRDEQVAQKFWQYSTDVTELILDIMIHPVLESFDAQTVQATQEDFAESITAINDEMRDIFKVITAMKARNEVLKELYTISQENTAFLRDRVIFVRQQVLQDQFANEEQKNQAKERLHQLSNAYQFIFDELQDHGESI